MLQAKNGVKSKSCDRLSPPCRRGPINAGLAFFMALAFPAQAELSLPKLSGRVVDAAGMLGEADKQLMTRQLAELEQKSTDQLVVVTLPSLQGTSIEDFGVRLARHWQIGQKDKNNGVLLIIAPKDRKVRIEVGYGLEGTLTDTLAGNIVHNRILPLFRKGQMAAGIKLGVTDIIDVLTGDAAGVTERAKGGKGRKSSSDGPDWVMLFIMAVWAFMFFGGMGRSIFRSSSSRGGVIIVPVGEASSHWSGGGGSSGGFGGGGGGFSGGGGSFGGGGSSGGW